jgi:preprotein translocase subunit SecA
LARLSRGLGGVWSGSKRREDLARQGLTALHLFETDKHYLVRDGKVQIVDEYTGRVMADRSWERGLHQMIEAKEGCQVTGRQETLARISYQRFFQRYLRLSGMTGTAREVAAELWSVYKLKVVTIPTHRPTRRRALGERLYADAERKWTEVLSRVRAIHLEGRPVLVGTRSVQASERLSRSLQAAGLPHRVLNARQDQHEAEIIAQAGRYGGITVATNMAGRGTDIRLADGVAERGGLHVLATERHDSRRIDRQLFGRGARQGDLGSFEVMLSLDDELFAALLGASGRRWLQRWSGGDAQLTPRLGKALSLLAQLLAERRHRQFRRNLLRLDESLSDMLAFSGRGE